MLCGRAVRVRKHVGTAKRKRAKGWWLPGSAGGGQGGLSTVAGTLLVVYYGKGKGMNRKKRNGREKKKKKRKRHQ